MLARYYQLAILVSLLVTPAKADVSSWEHNGSIVDLISEGTKRVFVYNSPSERMISAGASRGSRIFDGKRIGNTYEGSAYLYSSKCGAISYYVKGAVSDDQRSVNISGKAPVRDAECRVVSHRNDRLVFTFTGSSNSSAGNPQIAENATPARRPDLRRMNMTESCVGILSHSTRGNSNISCSVYQEDRISCQEIDAVSPTLYSGIIGAEKCVRRCASRDCGISELDFRQKDNMEEAFIDSRPWYGYFSYRQGQYFYSCNEYVYNNSKELEVVARIDCTRSP